MIYLFENPQTGEVRQVWQGMNEQHVYSDGGLVWNRVFTVPAAKIGDNPYSVQSFLDKTNNKGTLGDVWDRADDLSHKRASQNGGVDPIKQKYYKQYSKDRKGRIHPNANRTGDRVFTI